MFCGGERRRCFARCKNCIKTMNTCLHYSISLAIFSAITGCLLIPYGILHVCTSNLLPVDIFYLYLALSLSAPLKCKYLASEPFTLPPGEYEQAGWISCCGNVCGCTVSFFSCNLQESLPRRWRERSNRNTSPLWVNSNNVYVYFSGILHKILNCV